MGALAIVQLIAALLPSATELAFTIGNQIVKINTSQLTNASDVKAAFESAAKEGFPELEFKNTVV